MVNSKGRAGTLLKYHYVALKQMLQVLSSQHTSYTVKLKAGQHTEAETIQMLVLHTKALEVASRKQQHVPCLFMWTGSCNTTS